SAGMGYSALMNIPQPEVGLASLRGAAKVWARKGVPDELRAALVPTEKLVALVRDPDVAPANRATAVSLLAFATDASKILPPLTAKDQDQPIRLAAIGALSRQKGTEAWSSLLDGFSSDTPPIRRAIIDGLLANTDRTKLLLDAIEAGQIKVSEIEPLQVKRLTESRDAGIKERASKLLAAAIPADRAKA